MKIQETFTSKLGTFKGEPRARIWIEGTRLARAGFTVGAFYARTVTEGPAPTIVMTLLSDDDVINAPPLKVSGKGPQPIIDITGKRIARVFGSLFVSVDVTFYAGRILIEGGQEI